MRGSPPCDVWINAQPRQDPARWVTVEASVSVRLIGKLLRSTWLASDPRKVDDQRQDLLMVADIGSGDFDPKGNAVPIDHQGVFRALFSAVHGAGARQLATAERSGVDAVDDGDVRIQAIVLPQESQQIGFQVIPDAQSFP